MVFLIQFRRNLVKQYSFFRLSDTPEMPTHWCVPLCTRKGSRSESGEKISFFRFPLDNDLKKQWIHAIRRDVGKHFNMTNETRVCSRHFRADDFRKTHNGVIQLRDGVVPSVFVWKTSSPKRRKPPSDRPPLVASASQVRPDSFEGSSSSAYPGFSEEVLFTASRPRAENAPGRVVDSSVSAKDCKEHHKEKELDKMKECLRESTDCLKTLDTELEQANTRIREIEFAQHCNLFGLERFKTRDADISFYMGISQLRDPHGHLQLSGSW